MSAIGKAAVKTTSAMIIGFILLGFILTLPGVGTPGKVSMTTTSSPTGSETVTTDENGKVISRVVCTHTANGVTCTSN